MSDLESNTKGFFAKMKSDPVPAIGMGGFFGVIAYSIYNYRRRDPSVKPSVYVIQTRVAAQGLVIGLLTLSLGFHMYQNYLKKKDGYENALNYHQFHPNGPEHQNKKH